MQHVLFKDLVHPSWYDILTLSIRCMDKDYLTNLSIQKNWLPGMQNIFAAFRVSLQEIKYILLGESPYPRIESANGFAFWDANVKELWSNTGLSKQVNRATSLRNFIKMLLHAKGDLKSSFTQDAIAKLDTKNYIQTSDDLFTALLKHGFLLLNISLVYEVQKVPEHARHWQPFMSCLLQQLSEKNQIIKCVTLGKLAQKVPESMLFSRIIAEHPYNISFITNTDVLSFFQPFNLLEYCESTNNN
jgi:uracil-DNA glycosylase